MEVDIGFAPSGSSKGQGLSEVERVRDLNRDMNLDFGQLLTHLSNEF